MVLVLVLGLVLGLCDDDDALKRLCLLLSFLMVFNGGGGMVNELTSEPSLWFGPLVNAFAFILGVLSCIKRVRFQISGSVLVFAFFFLRVSDWYW